MYNNQNLATILMLGKNPRMLSGKITFLRDSCGGFALTSKTKRHFDYYTPPYFCDMCYFRRVDIHHINIKNTLRRKIKGFIYILSSSCLALFGSIFENFQKNHFLLHFGTFLKIMDFPHIFVSSNSIRQKWI